MKKLLTILVLLPSAAASAQLPVIDAAGLAQAAATVSELRQQVRLIAQAMSLTRDIRRSARETERFTGQHLRRFEAALTKRGVVPTTPLSDMTRPVHAALRARDVLSYAALPDLERVYLGHEHAQDPLAHARAVTGRSLRTMEAALQALAEHGRQIEDSHHELERFKQEIATAAEPQQMRDVQASLQVLNAREQLMTRQALVMLANLDAVKAAAELDRQAQARAQYEAFVGGTGWARSAGEGRRPFLRMPGR